MSLRAGAVAAATERGRTGQAAARSVRVITAIAGPLSIRNCNLDKAGSQSASCGPDAARSAILSLISGYAGEAREQKLLMVLQAYIDDSASDWADKQFHLAGYIMTAKKWAEFSALWKSVLDAPPSVACFKMNKARGDEGMAAKIGPLSEVIRKFRPPSIHCSMSRADFEETHSAKELRKVVTNPYFCCYLGVLHVLAPWFTEAGFRVPVDFIFDQQGGISEREAWEWYGTAKEVMGPRFNSILGSTPIFRSDDEVMPLQAADMLVSTLRRSGDPVFSSDAETKELLDVIVGDSFTFEFHINKGVLRSMANEVMTDTARNKA